MIYIHIPFCRSFCTYCSFYSEAIPVCKGRKQEDGESERFGRYAEAVVSEAAARAEEIRATMPEDCFSQKVDTLYIGGGTPSVLPSHVLSDIVTGVNNAVFGSPRYDYSEFTMEVNPEDIVEKGDDYVKSLLELGVNRISVGVQSFDDDVLRWMNRRHDAEHAEQAYWMLRSNGFRNISIDLIYGVGGLTDEVWEATVHKAIGLSPSHISAYQLSIEEGSSLAVRADSGKYQEASEETCRRQYETLCSLLTEAGYHHYEVSNFAYPGFEARHNSAYWRRVPYVGLGAGAHSALAGPDGKVNVRKWNSESESCYVSEKEILTEENMMMETVMLGLRTDAGVDPACLPHAPMSMLLDEGALEWTREGNLRIPEDHFFVSDEIIRELV